MRAMTTTNLLHVTLLLLDQQRGRWPSICHEAGVSYSWLSKLARGEIRNPTFQRLSRLHDHLVALQKKEAA